MMPYRELPPIPPTPPKKPELLIRIERKPLLGPMFLLFVAIGTMVVIAISVIL